MANRSWRELSGALDQGIVLIQGSFAPNGASAVSSASNSGAGWSVAHSATGQFTVTLQDQYVAMVSADASLQLASPDDKMLQFGAIDVTSAGTIVINVWDISSAGLADIAANAGNRIHFSLRLRNSTVA